MLSVALKQAGKTRRTCVPPGRPTEALASALQHLDDGGGEHPDRLSHDRAAGLG